MASKAPNKATQTGQKLAVTFLQTAQQKRHQAFAAGGGVSRPSAIKPSEKEKWIS